jgi:hypothetical protein
MLGRHNLPYLAVDADPARVARERRRGQPVYFGDGTYPEFLRACGIDRARALVITVDAPSAIEGIVAAARQERPNLTIVARARMRGMRPGSTTSESTMRSPKPSKRACSSRRRCSSTWACRWAT